MGTFTNLDWVCIMGRIHSPYNEYSSTFKKLIMFRNLRKERELIDRELAIYREEARLKIEQEILKYKETLNEMAKKCHDELAEYEHTYHSEKEERGIELGKLKAQINEFKERKELLGEQQNIILESAKSYQALLESKDAEIERLNDRLEQMIENIPEFPEINVTRR